MGKRLERIMRDKPVCYLESHSLVRDSQHDFRDKRSCFFDLLTFSNILSGHDITKSSGVVYLDFQKSLDKVAYFKVMFKVR